MGKMTQKYRGGSHDNSCLNAKERSFNVSLVISFSIGRYFKEGKEIIPSNNSLQQQTKIIPVLNKHFLVLNHIEYLD